MTSHANVHAEVGSAETGRMANIEAVNTWTAYVEATGGDKDQAGCALAFDLSLARAEQSGGYKRREQPSRRFREPKALVPVLDIPPPNEDGY